MRRAWKKRSIDRQSALAHNHLGLRFAAEGKLELAEKEFKTALAIDPAFAKRLEQFRGSLWRAGKRKMQPNPVEWFQEALNVCGDCRTRSSLHKDLGLLYSRSGHLVEGERQLRLALRQDPNDEEVLSIGAIERGQKKPTIVSHGALRMFVLCLI